MVSNLSSNSDHCFNVGKCGFYLGIAANFLMVLGALTVLFIILADLSYPILLAIYAWITPGENPEIVTDPSFSQFSSAYTSLILYFILVLLCSKERLGVFIRLGSLGAIFIALVVLFITGLGIYETYNTKY